MMLWWLHYRINKRIKSMSEAQESALPPTGQEPKPHTVKHGRTSKTAIGLLLILTLGVGGFSAYVYQQQLKSNSEMNALRSELQQFRSEQSPLQQNQQALKDSLANLGTQQITLDGRQRELENKWLEKEHQRPNDWMLAEASYLVRMAGRKLWLEQDLTTASALLIDADSRIQSMADPSLITLRKALANDIATLKSAPEVDREGLSLRVGTLVDNLDQLNIKGLEPEETENDPASSEVTDQISDWKSNFSKSVQQFAEHFITIRRRDSDVEALLSPDQSAYLQENMRLQLQLAQLSLLRQEQANFRDHLQKAQSWLTEYYEPNDSATQFMQKELTTLQEADITAHYPQTFSVQPLLEKTLSERWQTPAAAR
jgi:uroporphyrin-III C-methyltransferase